MRVGYAHNDFHSAIAGITNSTPDGSGLFVRDFSILGTWTRTINPNLLNQVLIQVVPHNSSQALPNADNGINFSLGNLGAPGLGGTSTFGEPSLIPIKRTSSVTSLKMTSRGTGERTRLSSVHPIVRQITRWKTIYGSTTNLISRMVCPGLIALAPAAVQGHLVGFNNHLANGLPMRNRLPHRPPTSARASHLRLACRWMWWRDSIIRSGMDGDTILAATFRIAGRCRSG